MKHKSIYLALLAGMLYTTVFAQPVIKHQRTLGGFGYDFFRCMNLTRDGGLIAGGYSYSDIAYEKTENSRGESDYWVVKLDSVGNIQWDKTVGGGGFELMNAVIEKGCVTLFCCTNFCLFTKGTFIFFSDLEKR